jgi:hypothetical protein
VRVTSDLNVSATVGRACFRAACRTCTVCQRPAAPHPAHGDLQASHSFGEASAKQPALVVCGGVGETFVEGT